jgi:hypothetical protein
MALLSEDAVYHRLVGDGLCYVSGLCRTRGTCAVHELASIDAGLILIQAYLKFLL